MVLVTISNRHSGKIGLTGEIMLSPGESATINLTEAELELWKQRDFVEIRIADIGSGGGKKPAMDAEQSAKGYMQQDSPPGPAPIGKRGRRSGKAESGNSGPA